MSFERLADRRIQDAIEAGAFRNLKGEGKPLENLDQDGLAGDNWMAFRVLKNGGMLPSWLELAREIERDMQRLEAIDRRHEFIAEAVCQRGWNPSLRTAIKSVRDEYEKLARQIRRKQDQFNMDAPAVATERPGIWVEAHLERLDARLPE